MHAEVLFGDWISGPNQKDEQDHIFCIFCIFGPRKRWTMPLSKHFAKSYFINRKSGLLSRYNGLVVKFEFLWYFWDFVTSKVSTKEMNMIGTKTYLTVHLLIFFIYIYLLSLHLQGQSPDPRHSAMLRSTSS